MGWKRLASEQRAAETTGEQAKAVSRLVAAGLGSVRKVVDLGSLLEGGVSRRVSRRARSGSRRTVRAKGMLRGLSQRYLL